MDIYFIGKARSFVKRLANSAELKHNFILPQNKVYKDTSKLHLMVSNIIRKKIFNYTGLIQIQKGFDKKCDIYGSFNRFAKTDRPYFILLEQPSALYHYTIGRNETLLGKRRIRKSLSDPNLKLIICRCKACYDTLEKLCGPIPKNCAVELIYSFVSTNKKVTEENIKKRKSDSALNLLFIAQGSRFYSKGGLEVIEAFRQLKNEGYNVKLCIITSLGKLDRRTKTYIESQGINIQDFNYTYEKLEEIYSKSHVLLHPTNDDSNALTVMEAMKGGMAVISTKLYAIPEMVKDGENGFLMEPKHQFFSQDNLPNPEVWNKRRQTIYSQFVSADVVGFLVNKLSVLYADRNKLESMMLKSWEIANSSPFSESYIVDRWNKVLSNIK